MNISLPILKQDGVKAMEITISEKDNEPKNI